MSINWNTRDLAQRLRKQHVAASQIMVGDVVVSDYGIWQVAKVDKEPNGFFSILDENDNGYMSVPPHQIYVIIHRGCFGP